MRFSIFMSKMIALRHSFNAMDTNIQAVININEGREAAGFQVLKRAEIMFKLLERVYSSYAEGSEISELNKSAGHHFKATPVFFGMVEAALQAARLTGGILDPTIPASFGDTDIENRPVYREEKGCPGITTGKDWRDVRLNATRLTVYLPPGCSLDLGGIGKGWAVDQISRIFLSFNGFYLDAGGHIRVGGRQTSRTPWTINIPDPFSNRDLKVFELNNGSACTTIKCCQRPAEDGRRQHYLIDPRTGKQAEAEAVSTTIISETAAEGAAVAKAALILGPETGMQLIRSLAGISGMMVLAGGEVLTSPGFPEAICVR
jgi:thiamine biosynthesis lipoprotein